MHGLAKGKLYMLPGLNEDFINMAKQQFQDLQVDRELLFSRASHTKVVIPGVDVERKGTEFYLQNWQAITSDQYVLECVSPALSRIFPLPTGVSTCNHLG
jgi:hypothetical protein